MLAADFLNLGKDVDLVNRAADIFHLDVMDGSFVPNLSFGFPVVEAIAKKAEKPLDVHLMIVSPWKYVERFASVKGVEMISFHLEAALGRTDGTIDLIHSCGVRAGIAINPDCPVESVFPYLDKVDFILVMSVFAGFGGQKFIAASLDRIRSLKAEIERRSLNVGIEVDGGVGPDNAGLLNDAGASILVAGSSVFGATRPEDAISAMR